MGVTELALLHLQPGVSLNDPAFCAGLQKARQAMEAFTRQPFYYFVQIEDPSFLYIVGSWQSVEQHLQEWVPSAINQELLELLKGWITVDWMFHLDVEPECLPLDAPVLVIARHFILADKRADCSRIVNAVVDKIEHSTAPWRVAAGWRLDKETGSNDFEEWVLFTGSDGIFAQKHDGQSREGFRGYAELGRDLVRSLDIRHAMELGAFKERMATPLCE